MPHNVFTDNTICPDLVDPAIYGHHKSITNRNGTTRAWMMESEEMKEKFEAALRDNPHQFIRGSASSRDK